MRRLGSLVSVVLVVSGLTISCGTGVETASRRVTLEDCLLKGAAGWKNIEARCGVWEVAEDRKDPQSGSIALRLAVVPSVSRNPDPVPLFVLVGGPGQAATETFGQLQEAFEKLHKTHDIVLVDQRGTGGSNPMRCPESEAEMLLPGMSDESLARAIRECLEGLSGDPGNYTTAESVEDLEEVREALGYGEVHLYGVSYGTRLAQEFIRRYPERVRSVVLDGVVPPSLALGTNVAKSAQRALELIFERCAKDPVCAEAYSDLSDRFEEVLERLKVRPQAISMQHPRTARVEEFTLTYELAAFSIRLLSYSPETVALIPLIIDSAWKGDCQPLAAQYLIVADRLGQTIADAMSFSVVCNEDFPFFDAGQIALATENTYLGKVQVSMMQKICSLWPTATVSADFKEPLRSNVPALLLSGEADPVTPPEYGEMVVQGFAGGRHLVVSGMGHNVVMRGCLPDLVTQFVIEGSVENLEVSCLNEIEASPFFSSFAGPQP